jgi:hypothetical protein
MAICEKTDLDEAFCAHCRGNTKTPVEQYEAETKALRAKLLANDPRWFPAQWPGVCGQCGTGFSPGSLIRQPAPPDYSWVAECCSAT